MMSAATGSSNAAIPGIAHVYKTPVPPIDAAANLALQAGVHNGYGSGATKFMSGCGRGYADVVGLKRHLHGQRPHYRSCTDALCISQAIAYKAML
jgi:hypothetical protein